jgi:hypothetical protein
MTNISFLYERESRYFTAQEKYELKTLTLRSSRDEGRDILYSGSWLPPFWRIQFPAFSGGSISLRKLLPAYQTTRCQPRHHNMNKLQVLRFTQ